ncbi:hypothetical protein BHM03_00011897 [Ensete ventricosum]|nr:hypothetical protein BHM03_00011897 [Ensete ventricosum]
MVVCRVVSFRMFSGDYVLCNIISYNPKWHEYGSLLRRVRDVMAMHVCRVGSKAPQRIPTLLTNKERYSTWGIKPSGPIEG